MSDCQLSWSLLHSFIPVSLSPVSTRYRSVPRFRWWCPQDWKWIISSRTPDMARTMTFTFNCLDKLPFHDLFLLIDDRLIYYIYEIEYSISIQFNANLSTLKWAHNGTQIQNSPDMVKRLSTYYGILHTGGQTLECMSPLSPLCVNLYILPLIK